MAVPQELPQVTYNPETKSFEIGAVSYFDESYALTYTLCPTHIYYLRDIYYKVEQGNLITSAFAVLSILTSLIMLFFFYQTNKILKEFLKKYSK